MERERDMNALAQSPTAGFIGDVMSYDYLNMYVGGISSFLSRIIHVVVGTHWHDALYTTQCSQKTRISDPPRPALATHVLSPL